jgi:hypothetical protein
MAISQPYVAQQQDQSRSQGPLDLITAGVQVGSQIQQVAQHLESQRVNDIAAMESVIKEWQDSGMFHQKIHEQPGFFKNYLSKVTRVQDPEQLKTMYGQYATGLRTWQEQQTTTQAELGELAQRAKPPEQAPPTQTPPPAPTPEPPMQGLNAGLKGDITRTTRTPTGGDIDYDTFLYEGTKHLTDMNIKLDPYEAGHFFVSNPKLRTAGTNLGDIFSKAEKWGKDKKAVVDWLFQDANYLQRARALSDQDQTMATQHESTYKNYQAPQLAPTYKADQAIKRANEEFHALPPTPGVSMQEKTITLKDQNLGAIKNGVFTATPNATKVDRQVVLEQLAESVGWTTKGMSAFEKAKKLATFASTLLGRNIQKYRQAHPALGSEEEARRAFLGMGGKTPAWKEVGFNMEITTPVDLSAAEILTADPKVPKAVSTQVGKIEPQMHQDIDKLAQLSPEDLANTLLAQQAQTQHGAFEVMNYDEAQANLHRLDRNASFLAGMVRKSPTAYNALKANLERVADLSGGIETLLGNSSLGNSAKDLMGMAAYVNAQANWAEAVDKMDPNSVRNQIEGGKLQVERLKVERELRAQAGALNGNDALSKASTLYLKGFNDIATKISLKNPDWTVADILKSSGAAQVLFKQYMFTLYQLRPENRGKSQAELAASFPLALQRIQTDKTWDTYYTDVLPEVAFMLQKPGTEMGGGGTSPTPAAPQKQKMDPASRAQINSFRAKSGMPLIDEYGEIGR